MADRMVEKVAQALYDAQAEDTDEMARAALSASCHEELVAALGEMLDCFGPDVDANEWFDQQDKQAVSTGRALLAKMEPT